MTEKQPPEKVEDPVANAYDLTSTLYFGHLKESLAAQYLTFPPFPEPVEGFSWLLAFTEPHRHPEEAELMLKKQAEMRKLLFSAVDFEAIEQILDIGCGHGSDLLQLSQRFDHLSCDGYTVSPRQYDLCAKRIVNSGLERRVRVFLRDSAMDPFPQTYDFMFGIEVAHHIENKLGLFSNMAGHLKDPGVIVLADVLSNTGFDLLQPDKGSFSISKESYAHLLGNSGFELTACTELTKEIANFLYDPNFEKNLADLNQRTPETRSLNEMHRDFNNVGTALKRGFICYLLLTIRKARKGLRSGQLTDQNLACLNNPLSYREALALAELGSPNHSTQT